MYAAEEECTHISAAGMWNFHESSLPPASSNNTLLPLSSDNLLKTKYGKLQINVLDIKFY